MAAIRTKVATRILREARPGERRAFPPVALVALVTPLGPLAVVAGAVVMARSPFLVEVAAAPAPTPATWWVGQAAVAVGVAPVVLALLSAAILLTRLLSRGGTVGRAGQ